MDGGAGSGEGGGLGGGGIVPDYDDDNYSEENGYQDIDYDDYDKEDKDDNEGDGNIECRGHADCKSDKNNTNDSKNDDNKIDEVENDCNIEEDEKDENTQKAVICDNDKKNVNVVQTANKTLNNNIVIEECSSEHIEINNNAPKNVPQMKVKEKVPLTRAQKHRKMTEALCDVLGDFGLVSFLPMNIQDAQVRTLQHSTVQYSTVHHFLFLLPFCFKHNLLFLKINYNSYTNVICKCCDRLLEEFC